MLVGLFATVLLGTPPATATEETPSSESVTDVAPQLPVREENRSGTELEPVLDDRERRALDRIASRYEAKIDALEELSLQVKGMELAALQRRIEDLKRAQSAEELHARIELARSAGDDRRLERLQQLYLPSSPPAAPSESRPLPGEDRERKTGGAR
jgi:hypothetical protein